MTSKLEKVVVVFKTHFDLGFTGLPAEVMSLYTGPMFAAVREVMRAGEGGPEHLRYTWTLPAWPLKQLLQDPSLPEETRKAARDLIEAGRLRWHAWPFTTHTAFCGLEELVRGLHISRALSEDFGRWPGAAKQTDVPGHTWALPMLLAKAGVRFLHLGCNAGSHPPDVPRLFWWEGPDGSRVLTFYSVGGYGTSPLPPEQWPYDTWLALQHTVDNEGPHSPEHLRRIREEIERGAPEAEIVFGGLDDFADALLARPEQLRALPVVSLDLADTWIHGVGSMPREVARVRELRRRLLRLEYAAAAQEWPGSGTDAGDFPLARSIAPLVEEAYEQMLLFGEHTWGLDVKSTIKRTFGKAFDEARTSEPYSRLESSWKANGAYVDRAEEMYERALARCQVPGAGDRTPGIGHSPLDSSSGLTPASRVPESTVLDNGRIRVEVDPSVGGIVSLVDRATGREWVDSASVEPFGGYRYDIYSAADIAGHLRAYGTLFQEWFLHDFGKPGYPEDVPHVTSYARDFELHNEGGRIVMRGGRLRAARGAELLPEQQVEISVEIEGAGMAGLPRVYLQHRIRAKRATALTESAVVPFPLRIERPTFRLGQTGSVIDPARDIAPGANRHLWCAEWLDVTDDRAGLGVVPWDMPLVSIGDVGLYRFSETRVPTEPVAYAHLYNTQWGTNFPQWLEGDFTFRTRLVPHAGDWREGKLWREVEEPEAARPGGTGDHAQPLQLPRGVALMSVVPRHDGPGIIVRLWDALGAARHTRLGVAGAPKAAWRCDLMERPIAELPVTHGDGRAGVDMRVGAHAVETILLEF